MFTGSPTGRLVGLGAIMGNFGGENNDYLPSLAVNHSVAQDRPH
jgi:hypothetical protein